MQYIFLAVCIIVTLGAVLGIPGYIFYESYKYRKYGNGNWVYMLKVNRLGTHIQAYLKQTDRNSIHDWQEVGKAKGKDKGKVEKKPFTYFIETGYTWLTSFPHFRKAWYQTSIPMAIYIDGIDTPIDILAAYRAQLELGQTVPLDSAAMAGVLHREKVAETALKAVMNPLNEGNWFRPWMLVLPAALLFIGLIVVGILVTQSGGTGTEEQLLAEINELKELLNGGIGPAPPTP